MEGKKVVAQVDSNGDGIRNIKPFLSVFIILIILLSGYYFIWRSITVKMKNIVADSLKDYKYDSITTGGFPFTKKVKVNNITFGNDMFLATKNQVNIKEIIVSSFIFSGTLDIKFKDVSTLSSLDTTIYSLAYNEEPLINISFYSNGSLKDFNYSDLGYRVISGDNKTLYTADKSNLNVKSVLNGDKVDYSISGDFQNMQNILIIEKDAESLIKEVPEIYNLKFDISSSITKKDGETESSTIKINSFDLAGNKNNLVSITGDIFKESGDPYSFGDVKVVLSNYNVLMKEYKTDVLEALKIENVDLSNDDKKQYISIVNGMFNEINNVIKKNPETTADAAVILISRAKNNPDYSINGESLFEIIQRIIK